MVITLGQVNSSIISNRSSNVDHYRSGQHFVKFVNMLMNDTTFLLDESMVTLKSIRELQDLMDNVAEWNSLPRVSDVSCTYCAVFYRTFS